MRRALFTITPLSALGTEPRGDQLFGQLCCQIAAAEGEQRLDQLLEGYTSNRPFLVLSDLFPSGHLPRPCLPPGCFEATGAGTKDRKEAKRRVWLPAAALSGGLDSWREAIVGPDKLLGEKARPFRLDTAQPHNTINRLTNTTGSGPFAPFAWEQIWFAPGATLECYAVFDESRVNEKNVHQWLQAVGARGFGRDTSAGLGKFDAAIAGGATPPGAPEREANAFLTLAPVAPQGGAWRSDRCFYKPFTRFGRHGGASSDPYKAPLLLAQSGAVLCPAPFVPSALYLGQGLGGPARPISRGPATVHQGYAPVVRLRIPDLEA